VCSCRPKNVRKMTSLVTPSNSNTMTYSKISSNCLIR
jgi:hypothetical protein